MKKLFLVVLAMGLYFTGNVLAEEGDIGIDVAVDTENNILVEGPKVEQNQWMGQGQGQELNNVSCGGQGGAGGKGGEGGSADSKSNAELNHSGNSNVEINGVKGGEGGKADSSANSNSNSAATNKTDVNGVKGEIKNTYNNITKRSHINAPTGPSGNFLNATAISSDGWQLFICQPLYKRFYGKELKIMANGAGGFFSSGIEESLRIEKVESFDEAPLVRLDFIPNGENDRIIGEFEFQADEPIPFGKALAYVLLKAKEDTNTHRVVVWARVKGEVKNSGFSIGSGVAGSKLWGPGEDSTAGAIGLGGLIGTTTARTQEVWMIRVIAFNDGSIDPPPGVEVCGLTMSAPTAEVEEEAIIESTPPCDARQFEDRIAQLKEAATHCLNECLNNMLLWKQIADSYVEWYKCDGRKNTALLSQASIAYARSEKNFLEGSEPDGTKTKNLSGAQELLYNAKYNWSWCILELQGPDDQMDFGFTNGLKTVPETNDNLK